MHNTSLFGWMHSFFFHVQIQVREGIGGGGRGGMMMIHTTHHDYVSFDFQQKNENILRLSVVRGLARVNRGEESNILKRRFLFPKYKSQQIK